MAKPGAPKKAAKKSAVKKPGLKASAAKAVKKKAAAKTPAKKTASKTVTRGKATKDPKGGLTQAGREYFKETEGSNLRPGVQGKADTPEKKKRKGSFLRRHFANPRGPMEKDGEPTRLALSAHAWGEPVPQDKAAAKKLAKKGTKLLEQYQESKDEKTAE